MTGTESDVVTKVWRSGQLSQTVVTAVAEATRVDPLDLDPLYTVIDPDALDRLFRPSIGFPQPSMELSFSMADCQVVIHGDGEVVVTPAAATDEPPTTVALHQE